MIDRRTLSTHLAAATATAVIARRALAQQPNPLPRVGMLLTQSPGSIDPTGRDKAFREAIATLGWADGQNVDLVMRSADGDLTRLPALAVELVALQPDVILTHTSSGALAAQAATSTIPIVVGPASEDALLELVGSLARPHGNMTGLTFSSLEENVKLLELLVQAHPKARRIGVLADPQVGFLKTYPEPMLPAARTLGVELFRFEARRPELTAALATLASRKFDALHVPTMPGFNSAEAARAIIEPALALGIAVVGSGEFYAREGGLLSMGADYLALVRRAAVYVDKILKGAKPADLPVERPSVYRLLVNRRTAERLGIMLPPAILLRADEVIE